MRLVLNVIWLLFGGLWMAAGYVLAALISFLLVITIPFGVASLRIASYALWPFGRTIVDKPTAGTGALLGNVIWCCCSAYGWQSVIWSARSQWRSRSSAFRWRWPTSN